MIHTGTEQEVSYLPKYIFSKLLLFILKLANGTVQSLLSLSCCRLKFFKRYEILKKAPTFRMLYVQVLLSLVTITPLSPFSRYGMHHKKPLQTVMSNRQLHMTIDDTDYNKRCSDGRTLVIAGLGTKHDHDPTNSMCACSNAEKGMCVHVCVCVCVCVCVFVCMYMYIYKYSVSVSVEKI